MSGLWPQSTWLPDNELWNKPLSLRYTIWNMVSGSEDAFGPYLRNHCYPRIWTFFFQSNWLHIRVTYYWNKKLESISFQDLKPVYLRAAGVECQGFEWNGESIQGLSGERLCPEGHVSFSRLLGQPHRFVSQLPTKVGRKCIMGYYQYFPPADLSLPFSHSRRETWVGVGKELFICCFCVKAWNLTRPARDVVNVQVVKVYL